MAVYEVGSRRNLRNGWRGKGRNVQKLLHNPPVTKFIRLPFRVVLSNQISGLSNSGEHCSCVKARILSQPNPINSNAPDFET